MHSLKKQYFVQEGPMNSLGMRCSISRTICFCIIQPVRLARGERTRTYQNNRSLIFTNEQTFATAALMANSTRYQCTAMHTPNQTDVSA